MACRGLSIPGAAEIVVRRSVQYCWVPIVVFWQWIWLRTANERMSLSVCTDISSSDWLVGQDIPWYQLSAIGPAGFPAYARLRFLPDTPIDGRETIDGGFAESWYEDNTESEQFSVVLEVLSRYTSTPDDCYFLGLNRSTHHY